VRLNNFPQSKNVLKDRQGTCGKPLLRLHGLVNARKIKIKRGKKERAIVNVRKRRIG
jgi:hypothetical protein